MGTRGTSSLELDTPEVRKTDRTKQYVGHERVERSAGRSV